MTLAGMAAGLSLFVFAAASAFLPWVSTLDLRTKVLAIIDSASPAKKKRASDAGTMASSDSIATDAHPEDSEDEGEGGTWSDASPEASPRSSLRL